MKQNVSFSATVFFPARSNVVTNDGVHMNYFENLYEPFRNLSHQEAVQLGRHLGRTAPLLFKRHEAVRRQGREELTSTSLASPPQ